MTGGAGQRSAMHGAGPGSAARGYARSVAGARRSLRLTRVAPERPLRVVVVALQPQIAMRARTGRRLGGCRLFGAALDVRPVRSRFRQRRVQRWRMLFTGTRSPRVSSCLTGR